jgi:hypothetical protein
MKKLSQILKEGLWDEPRGLDYAIDRHLNSGAETIDSHTKRTLEGIAEETPHAGARHKLFQFGTRFIHRALARNPNLSYKEVQQLLMINDPDINESLDELYGENEPYGEGSEQEISEGNENMNSQVISQQMSVVADFLTQRVPESEIINLLVRKHKMDPQKAEILVQSAKNMIRSGH